MNWYTKKFIFFKELIQISLWTYSFSHTRTHTHTHTHTYIYIYVYIYIIIINFIINYFFQEDKSEDGGASEPENLVDLTKPLPPEPPEFRKSHLYESPRIFEQVDTQVFEVSI